MAELVIHNRNIETVFDLIGDWENDITKSIAWSFVKCPYFLEMIIESLLNIKIDAKNVIIRYQEFEKDKGITDLEITDNSNFYIIIEAKRGWILPLEDQLKLYSGRTDFKSSPVKSKAIVSMSECTEQYAVDRLPKVAGTKILHLPWNRICDIAKEARTKSPNAQKYILDELERYIRRIMTTQNKDTNWVYVVSLGMSAAEITTYEGKKLKAHIDYLDIVKKYHKYCCPVGGGRGGWPKEPLTYIAFRYEGKLQSIHHVERYSITDNLHPFVPEIPDEKLSEMHFVYDLGPAIVPSKEIRTGKSIVMSNRVWAQLDTLLTSDTITEAMEISKARK